MLKRSVLFVLVFIFALTAFAFGAEVTLDMVRKVATTHLKAHKMMMAKRPGKGPGALGEYTIRDIQRLSDDKTKKSLAYVVNVNPTGFVVTSSNTDITPVIAYSYENDFVFKDIEGNVLLEILRTDLQNRLKAIPYTSANIITDNNLSWDHYISGDDNSLLGLSKGNERYYVETEWAQSGRIGSSEVSYNKYCPVDPRDNSNPKRHSLTGCVATSMGQIINYWDYPSSVIFSPGSAYTPDGWDPTYDAITKSEANITNIEYNNGDPPPDMIARLLFACGVSVEMDYGAGGSSAKHCGATGSATAFKKWFDYTSANCVNHKDGDFYDRLETNMINGQPAQLGILIRHEITGELTDDQIAPNPRKRRFSGNFKWSNIKGFSNIESLTVRIYCGGDLAEDDGHGKLIGDVADHTSPPDRTNWVNYDTGKYDVTFAHYHSMFQFVRADYVCYLGPHSIVCDGYNGANAAFHLNFGKGPHTEHNGNHDVPTEAWYSLPEGMPWNYNFVFEAVVDITPMRCDYEPTELTVNADTKTESVKQGYLKQYKFPVIADGRTYNITVTPIEGDPDLYASRYQDDTECLDAILNWEDTCPVGSDHCASSTNPGQVSELVTFTAPTDGIDYDSYFPIYGNWADAHNMVRYKVKVTYTTQEQGLADVALILDSSGSMSWNDPSNVRHTAARYFVDLAYADALAGASKMQIAIVDFDSYARTWAHLTMVDTQANHDLLWNAIGRVNSSGGTNLERGLDQGYSELSASSYPSARKAGVMLTDGQGSYYDGAVQYANRGWDVYTLGLSNDVNQNLLYNIAHTTEHGEYYTCTTENMQTVYNKIKAQITGGSILATFLGFINQGQQIWNSLPIGEGLSSLQVSANWQGSQLQLTLVDPNGRTIDPGEAAIDPTISYAQSNTYSMYTIVNPESGEWQTCVTGVDVPTAGEAYTTLASVKSPVLSNFLPFEPNYSVGDSLSIGVYFGEETTPGHYDDVTGLSVSATVYRPDGATADLILYDDGLHNDREANDGRYANTYRNLNFNGSYLVRVKAEENGAVLRTLQETIQVGPRNAVYISGASLLPEPGSTTENLAPLIKATIWGPAANIDENTIDLQLDGTTVSHNWDAANQIVSYTPSSYLSGQRHTVELSLRDAAGHPVTPVTWSFDVLASDLSVNASAIRPSRPFPGDTLIFSAVVHCDSAVLPLDSVKVGFYDGNPDSGGVEFAEKTIHGIYTGDYDTVKTSWIFPHPICGYLYVKVDPENVIKEWDETDNQKPILVLPSLPSTVEFVPDRLDLTPGHPPVKCYIELPTGYQVKGIDEVTLRGCTDEHIDPYPDPWEIGDYDGDGNPDLMVTFDWLATLRVVDPRTCGVATIRGSVIAPEPFQDSLLTFQGKDTITVVSSGFGGCISGLISTADTQEPISGVTVQILKDTLIVGKDTTDTDGHYSISYVLPDIYQVLASKKGLGSLTKPGVESVEAETTVVNFQFPSVGVPGEREAKIPKVFSLSQNYPNPFNPVTTIKYGLPEDAYVRVTIYNISGQRVCTLVDENEGAGYHQVSWDGKGMASGIYFYRIEAGQFTQTRKMIMLK